MTKAAMLETAMRALVQRVCHLNMRTVLSAVE